MTRAGAAEQLRTLATVAVRNLAAPAVIRPRRDGWLIFTPGEGYAWHGTARRPRTRCSPASTAAACRPDSADQAPGGKRGWSRACWHGRLPDARQPPAGPGSHGLTRQRSHPAAQRAVYREPSCRPCRIHCPVTQHSLR